MSSQPQSMSELPPIYILPTHLQQEQLHDAEDALYQAGGRLTYRASEARIFLGKVLHKKRAAFDLRAAGVWTKEESLSGTSSSAFVTDRTAKRRKLNPGRIKDTTSDAATGSDDQDESDGAGSKIDRSTELRFPDLTEHIMVLKLEWIDECNKNDKLAPFKPYLIYSGKIIPKPDSESAPAPLAAPIEDSITYIKAIPESRSQTSPSSSLPTTTILDRAKADKISNGSTLSATNPVPFHRRKFGQKTSPTSKTARPKLHHATTSENESISSSKIPPPPAWVNEPHPRPIYSCLRDTPPLETNPNQYFIRQLEKVKETRQLTMDEIGVRAYSTAIASLAAYPHRIISSVEVSRLPGCSDKIAALWTEWHQSVTLSDTLSIADDENEKTSDGDDNDNDSDTRDITLDPHRLIPPTYLHQTLPASALGPLTLFHSIWGVGPETARKFHYTHGWQDLDDIVEFGWSSANLTRSQQIGLKFHHEFQLPIPRAEVESIARHILNHARLVRNIPGEYQTNDVLSPSSQQKHNNSNEKPVSDVRDFTCAIVGSYRRGKPSSGDVDVIVSHRDERMTRDLIFDLVQSLEFAGYITHTLTVNTPTSDRGEQTLPFTSGAHAGKGFDSLDKALVVWQDPCRGSGSDSDLGGEKKKNKNPHRRVDIIISPWRTIGCAVLGWSGGTTFQRDVRRWVKREKGWKFDSSGVRDRATGRSLDLESVGLHSDGEGGTDGHGKGDTDTWEDREKRIMERLGIGWREPRLRCTG